jgi:hypothetical protein
VDVRRRLAIFLIVANVLIWSMTCAIWRLAGGT